MVTRLFRGFFARITRLYVGVFYSFSKKYDKEFDKDLCASAVPQKFISLQKQYMFFHHSFWNKMPVFVQEHRSYFRQEQRGFGEDAFHSMWYELLREYRPQKLLEIGVYRGQVMSLWALVAKELNIACDIHGISPFSSAGDTVSAYIGGIDYYDDVIENFNHFSLPLPNLHKGFSTDSDMVDVIKSKKWDLIYIDGSHDYDVVKSDFLLCGSMLSKNGLVILDDSAMNTDFRPPVYASSGHPGPSELAAQIDGKEFREILSVGHNRVFQKI